MARHKRQVNAPTPDLRATGAAAKALAVYARKGSTRRPPTVVRAAVALLALSVLAAWPPGHEADADGAAPTSNEQPALAGDRGGPILAVGYSHKYGGRSLVHYAVGWQLRLSLGERVESWGKRAGVGVSLVIEPLLGVTTGHTDSVEVALVPMLFLERRLADRWGVFLEAGVGLMYSDVRDFDLGSRVLFSDQIGVGLSRKLAAGHRLRVGWRLRHISHAGLWAETNSGLNTHYLTLSWE